jgi:hypothetical protein
MYWYCSIRVYIWQIKQCFKCFRIDHVNTLVEVMLRLTASQYVLVSSILFSVSLSLWGALYEEKSGLSPVSHFQQYLVSCQKLNIIYIVHLT